MSVDVTPKPDLPAEVYLGDGLYASFDGFMIRLRAPREDGDHVVFLEQAMFQELVQFTARFWS